MEKVDQNLQLHFSTFAFVKCCTFLEMAHLSIRSLQHKSLSYENYSNIVNKTFSRFIPRIVWVFGHFVNLALNGLTFSTTFLIKDSIWEIILLMQESDATRNFSDASVVMVIGIDFTSCHLSIQSKNTQWIT